MTMESELQVVRWIAAIVLLATAIICIQRVDSFLLTHIRRVGIHLLILLMLLAECLKLLLQAVVHLVWVMLSDLVTFPLSFSPSRYKEKDDEDDLCRMAIHMIPLCSFCPLSLETPDDVDFYDCRTAPPTHLLGSQLESFARPPSSFPPPTTAYGLEMTPWQQFHFQLNMVGCGSMQSVFFSLSTVFLPPYSTWASDFSGAA